MTVWFEPQSLTPLLTWAGWLAPAVFAVVFVVVTLLGVPRTILTVTAGWVFGFWGGGLLAWAAGVLAAWTGYELARFVASSRGSVLGRSRANMSPDAPSWEPAQGRACRRDGLARGGSDGAHGRAGEAAMSWVSQRARLLPGGGGSRTSPLGMAMGVVSARLVPVLPFAVVNYVCGVARVTRPAFLLGSGVGLLPGAAVYSAVGAGLSAPGWVQVLTLSAGSAVALAALGAAAVRRCRVSTAQPTTSDERAVGEDGSAQMVVAADAFPRRARTSSIRER